MCKAQHLESGFEPALFYVLKKRYMGHSTGLLLGRTHCKTMNKKKFQFTTLMICRAGLIAALYAVLTWVLNPFAYGPFQIRPAEGLVVLAVFYVEAIPGLYVGCMLANLLSAYGAPDIFLGSLATLAAAGLSFGCGRLFRHDALKLVLCAFFNIILNAFIIPAVIMMSDNTIGYWYTFGSMILTETVWIFSIGTPLYFALKRLIDKKVRVMLPLVGFDDKNFDGEKNVKKA